MQILGVFEVCAETRDLQDATRNWQTVSMEVVLGPLYLSKVTPHAPQSRTPTPPSAQDTALLIPPHLRWWSARRACGDCVGTAAASALRPPLLRSRAAKLL
mmetsp:Transcript_18841/g.51835  ORF Transcript_18841/g.51835 Transcript_18841/m.51835 type:complete len:101 (+) Transcript_18841:802-1104(+)